MTSSEEETSAAISSHTSAKKRRVQRACDVCRRRKSRCDGDRMLGSKCTTCSMNDLECTYVEAGKIRRVSKDRYVESLESRLQQMERLFSKLCPDLDVAEQLRNEAGNDVQTGHGTALSSSPSSVSQPLYRSSTLGSRHQSPTLEDPVSSDEEVDMLDLKLTESIRKMAIDPTRHRFFGKSSGLKLIQQALDLKKEHTGDRAENMLDVFYRKEPTFLRTRQWENLGRNMEEPQYSFPEPDLCCKLIDLYFTYNNPITPVLHRPTFERKYADGLHLRDSAFGAVVLLVCAVASPGCDDPRVLLPGIETEHSAGRQYFEQVQIMRTTLLAPPCLEDMQVYCLSAIYVQGTSTPQACWTIVGIGIRLAQDVGAHRRKVYNRKPTVEDELWKRAFWILVSLDRAYSTGLGRPCAIQDTDYDLDFPVVCDDEYWEHQDPEQSFKQPPGKPSYVAYFVSALELGQVLAFALRTIYSINRSKVMLGFTGHKWEQHIVSELDSALNKWIDSVPDHLRWDPNIQDPTFLLQSCALYAGYYYTQILVHRPFIPSARKPSPLSYPSLAICTNAARSCCHVVDGYVRRAGMDMSPLPIGIQSATVTSGIVLLVSIWGGKRSGMVINPEKEMVDVHKCMAVLKLCERRYPFAGKFWDLLYELASAGDLPLPQARPTGAVKREREEDLSSVASVLQAEQPESEPRNIARLRRVARSSTVQPDMHTQSIQAPSTSFIQATSTTHLFNEQPQRQHQSQQQTANDQMNLGATALSTSQPPQTQHVLRSGDLDPFGAWLDVGATSLDPSSIMAAYDTSNVGDTSEINGFHAQEFVADGSDNSTATSHVPYGFDHFLFYLMQQQQQQHPSIGIDGSAMTGFENTGTNGMAMTPQATASDIGSSHTDGNGTVMWSSTPTDFQVNDWGSYLSNASGTKYGDGTQPQHRQDRSS
ncbi:hypothetical protein CONPUDRAFT_142812 [Coniophora puteana RWD-64-598 SS2]|uniref:Zn(2)-C6 fungal-type domain-containing protein n=1 Tax=Coniophora puteana (strain RWD-64-598) TaxID=741705 RepID=A0A5M3MZP1_CONPW|nr:uncharacterized protein CONPUDRAFT_142812 [Coniophora puteana RWD-64-598 SS2]EIW84598.1 hypothetical protein CONPUDRAFT_142812 [Coniophora puteana RWD-64-598 SS2]